MTSTTRGLTVATLALGLLGLGATAAEAATTKPATQDVAIRFTAVAGEQPVTCGVPVTGLGSTGRTGQIADFRFFVSGVKLIRADGRYVPLKPAADSAYRMAQGGQSVTLVDLENGAGKCAEEGTPGTNRFVRGTVPRGRYVGVRWTLGVPSALNHTDATTALAPLNSAAMAWSWQAGRKFTKIEVTDTGATGPAGTFFVHVGGAGCTGNPATASVTCAKPNRAQVRLKRFDPAKQQVAVDLKALIGPQDLAINRAGAPGCMSGPTDPECGPVFRALGIGWAADGSGNGASPAGPDQTVFRAIAR